MLNRLGTYAGIALLWLLSCLPYRWTARFGEWLGEQLFKLRSSRRHVVLTNLRLCFPELDDAQRLELAREHFRWLIRSFAERGLIWFGSAARVRKWIRLNSAVDLAVRTPRILLGMHTVGIEAGALGLTAYLQQRGIGDSLSLYTPMSNALMEKFVAPRRERFGGQMVERAHSGLKLIRQIRSGALAHVAPDMDFGVRDSVFAPFFGVPACTLTAISRLTRQTGAQVVPVVTIMLPDYQGYEVHILPPWDNYPGAGVIDDTRRMNAFFEEQIRAHPAQYYWVHKRFKTRPPEQPSVY